MYRDSQEHASKWGEIYMLHICIERSVEAQFNRNTCILCSLHLLLTCLNSSQPCHLNFAAKRINVQCFFKKRFKLYCMLHCFVKTTVRVFKTANFIFARCIDKWSCTAFNLNHLNTRKKKSDFKIQTLLNFLSSLLRAQRRTSLPSMITTDIGMSG